jgi:hypothetical protein
MRALARGEGNISGDAEESDDYLIGHRKQARSS